MREILFARLNSEETRIWLNIAIIFGVVGVLQFLCVVLCREWIKNDLRQKMSTPLSVRWRPFACTRVSCAFKVTFSDFKGFVHQARCRTYWHRRNVTWEDDEIIGYTDEGAI